VKRLKNFLKNEELDDNNVVRDKTAGMNSATSFGNTTLIHCLWFVTSSIYLSCDTALNLTVE